MKHRKADRKTKRKNWVKKKREFIYPIPFLTKSNFFFPVTQK